MTDLTRPDGGWTHSFEEDADGLEVYRPTLDYAFPPSRRGRRRLTFGDGEVVESEPGPDDRPQPRGTLPAIGPARYEAGAASIDIVEAGPDLLRIRRS